MVECMFVHVSFCAWPVSAQHECASCDNSCSSSQQRVAGVLTNCVVSRWQVALKPATVAHLGAKCASVYVRVCHVVFRGEAYMHGVM
jgi:hypothetical protein